MDDIQKIRKILSDSYGHYDSWTVNQLLSLHNVSKAKAKMLDCKTCIWFKCETLEAPCKACFGRKKHVAIK